MQRQQQRPSAAASRTLVSCVSMINALSALSLPFPSLDLYFLLFFCFCFSFSVIKMAIISLIHFAFFQWRGIRILFICLIVFCIFSLSGGYQTCRRSSSFFFFFPLAFQFSSFLSNAFYQKSCNRHYLYFTFFQDAQLIVTIALFSFYFIFIFCFLHKGPSIYFFFFSCYVIEIKYEFTVMYKSFQVYFLFPDKL